MAKKLKEETNYDTLNLSANVEISSSQSFVISFYLSISIKVSKRPKLHIYNLKVHSNTALLAQGPILADGVLYCNHVSLSLYQTINSIVSKIPITLGDIHTLCRTKILNSRDFNVSPPQAYRCVIIHARIPSGS